MAAEKKIIKKQPKVRRALTTGAGGLADAKGAIVTPAKRVIKDSPVRGRFSRRKIRAAVEAVARRRGAT